MLVLSRKAGESIKIGDDIIVVVNRIAGSRVTIALEAPRSMRIVRGELRPFDDIDAGVDAAGLDETGESDESPAKGPISISLDTVSDVSSTARLRHAAR
ncbi:MAG: carbon storage regulator [Pirellulales bacterium]|nr:carbon storage regulator [Pirellulales bacterium]